MLNKINGKFQHNWFRLKTKIKAWNKGFSSTQEYIEYEKIRFENNLAESYQRITILNRKVDDLLLEVVEKYQKVRGFKYEA